MKKALKLYKWLNNLPESFFLELDFEEVYLDHSNLNFDIEQLEIKYDANVMIYKADNFNIHNSKKKQLCQYLKMKNVPKLTVENINRIEKESSVLISIVLYENPVQFKI